LTGATGTLTEAPAVRAGALALWTRVEITSSPMPSSLVAAGLG
jgi:hypothetical protein